MMTDGFKDEVSLWQVNLDESRNSKKAEYKPEDALHGLRCRIRKSEDPQTGYKIFFDSGIKVKKGDCVVCAANGEIYQVEAVKPVSGKREVHHITCMAKSVPNMARLVGVVAE